MMRRRAMRSNYLKARPKTAILGIAILFLAAGLSSAQSVQLTALRQNTVLPDGNAVPMWGWQCGAVSPPATCTTMNRSVQAGGTSGQPPLITVPTGSSLTITLNNGLPVETSLVIVGQLGAGSSTTGVGNPTRESSPRAHQAQTETTWTTNVPASFTLPAEGRRARSFAQEAAAGGSQTYTW